MWYDKIRTYSNMLSYVEKKVKYKRFLGFRWGITIFDGLIICFFFCKKRKTIFWFDLFLKFMHVEWPTSIGIIEFYFIKLFRLEKKREIKEPCVNTTFIECSTLNLTLGNDTLEYETNINSYENLEYMLFTPIRCTLFNYIYIYYKTM